MPKIKPVHQKLILFFFLALTGVVVGLKSISFAGSLTDVSVTMDNSRLSYLGELAAAAGTETKIQITDTVGFVDGNTAGVGGGPTGAPEQNTDILKVNDTLVFETDTTNITEIINGDELNIDTALANDNSSGDTFYMKETSNLTVSFTPASAVTGSATALEEGYFRVLVPATTDDSNDYHSDGKPDSGNFDFNSGTTASITCPDDVGGGSTYDFPTSGNANANDGTVTVDSQEYHYFTCNYEGTGGTSSSLSLTINNLVNPAPKATHTVGTADTYSIIVQQMDGEGTDGDQTDDTVVDQTTVKIGAIEAVKISAEVVPSLTFTIAGVTNSDVGAAQTLGEVCGLDNSADTIVTTSADAIPFGAVDTGTFFHGIQALTITTNAVDGAAVTAIANDQPGLNGGTCAGDAYNAGANDYTCIWDSEVTDMTHELEKDWGTTVTDSNHGYGYALHDDDANATVAFAYDDPGTWMARHYADAEIGSQDPVELFNSGSQPTDGADVYVCTRLIPDSLTSAGYYYNYITYTATAQF